MEFIDGETLRQWMASRIGQIGDVLTVTEQVAAALDAAHAAGIVHRDIKPENIMVRRDGYVKIVDFGLAKLTTPDADGTPAPTPARAQSETLPGVVLGTTRYMSPEQVRGLQVDARADLWSLGVVLYEMLTGHVPFEGPTPSDVLAAILQREPPPVPRYASEVPEALAWVVAKALMKEREERYQTAREMLADVRRLRQQCEVAVAGQPYSRYEGPTVMATEGKKTVVFVDQARFTKGADEVYQLLGAQAVAQFKLQLEEMIDAALTAAGIAHEGLHRESTGDGVMLILANPEQGCRFAEALHRAAARYNQSRSHPDAQRHFRIGIYTDHVSFIRPADEKGTARRIAGGMAPAFAQRLETACRTGEVLICPQTWAALPSLMQQQYGPKKKVRGKAHDRTLWAHRQKVIEPAPWDRPGVLSTFRQAPLRLSVSLLGLLLAGLCAVFVIPHFADQTTLQRPTPPTLSVPAPAEPPTPLATPYALGLALGATGLVVMALGGLGHHAGHSSVAHHLPGHASSPGGHGHHDLSLHGHSHGHGHLFGGKFWALLSPRVVFSFLVGAGASGLLLRHWLSEPLVAVGALAGGVLFERYVVTPIWNGLLRFASAPARTLEQAVFEVARAATDFDAQGQGLITLELDGQLVQVLGILRPEERASGIRVRQGGRVRIDAVDAIRNRCSVSSLDP
jgi:class 3 adenylate cyclase